MTLYVLVVRLAGVVMGGAGLDELTAFGAPPPGPGRGQHSVATLF